MPRVLEKKDVLRAMRREVRVSLQLVQSMLLSQEKTPPIYPHIVQSFSKASKAVSAYEQAIRSLLEVGRLSRAQSNPSLQASFHGRELLLALKDLTLWKLVSNVSYLLLNKPRTASGCCKVHHLYRPPRRLSLRGTVRPTSPLKPVQVEPGPRYP